MKTLIFSLCLTLAWGDLNSTKIKPCVYIKHNATFDDVDFYPDGKCRNYDICVRNFSSTIINLPPYSNPEMIKYILERCCKCEKNISVATLQNLSELNEEDFKDSDFIHPVVGPTEKGTVYGLHFIPIYDVTDYYYITPAPPNVFQRMMRTMEKVYPLLVLCILMTTLSGFITWLIETKDNREDFPRPFLIGWFEGTWWSFISMTTVGYGDKTPKTVAGRIFAVFWILIGITMFGILTGLITSAIQESETPVKPTMKDKNVGVLNYRTLDIAFLAASGGKAVINEATSFDVEIIKLIWRLKNQEYDGILLDKSTYDGLRKMFYFENLNSTNPWIEKLQNESSLTLDDIEASIDFFKNSIKAYPYPYNGEGMSYGILVKDEMLNHYLRDAILDNRMVMKTADLLKIKNTFKSVQKDYKLFDVKSKYFHTAIIILFVLLAVAALIGFAVEKSKLFCFTNQGQVDVEVK